MAASELKSNNARSPRYSTSKALGFKGGSTGPTGNIQAPTFQQIEGARPAEAEAAAAAAAETPAATAAQPSAISQFTAGPTAPKPTSVGSSIAATAGGLAAGEALKAGGGAVLNAAKGALATGRENSTASTADTVAGVQFAKEAAAHVSPSDVMPPAYAGDATMPAAIYPYAGGVNNGVDFSPNAYGDGTNNGVDFPVDVADDLGGLDLENTYASLDGASDAADAIGAATDFGDGINYGADIAGEALGDAGAGFGPIGYVAGKLAAPEIVEGATNLFQGVGDALQGIFGGCFITEAVMSSGGRGDTSEELEVLRSFRDSILSQTPEGQSLIQEYEAIAPIVVEAVMGREDSLQIFQAIDSQFINPAVAAVKAGDHQKALQIYAQMISFVAPYAAEAGEAGAQIPGATGQVDALQKFGEHAAMIGHDPLASGMATGDMGGMLDDDPTGYDGGPQTPAQSPGIMEQYAAKPRY